MRTVVAVQRPGALNTTVGADNVNGGARRPESRPAIVLLQGICVDKFPEPASCGAIIAAVRIYVYVTG